MNISIFGIGYVGAVSAACLARDGHEVIAVDVNPEKVATIRNGRSPIVEPGLEGLIAEARRRDRLSATTSTEEAVHGTDAATHGFGDSAVTTESAPTFVPATAMPMTRRARAPQTARLRMFMASLAQRKQYQDRR